MTLYLSPTLPRVPKRPLPPDRPFLAYPMPLNWSKISADQWSAALSGNSDAQAAFNQAIAEGQTKEDAFNAALASCSDQQERSTLITETLNGLLGEAGQQYQETNKDLLASRDAQNEMNQSMQELGEAALPVKTAVTEIGTSLLNTLAPARSKPSRAGTRTFRQSSRRLLTTSL